MAKTTEFPRLRPAIKISAYCPEGKHICISRITTEDYKLDYLENEEVKSFWLEGDMVLRVSEQFKRNKE